MADQEQVELLKKGVAAWNEWREDNTQVVPDLQGADLRGYVLQGVNFKETNLCNTMLRGADLNEADLSDAKLSGADLNGATLILTNLSGADLIGVNLSGIELYRANLSWADLSEANLLGANLSRAELIGADLAAANLRGARLRKADLGEASLIKANLRDADMSMTQALKTDFSFATFTGACLEDWHINNATFLENIDCLYVYLKYQELERRPSIGEFAPGEFTKLFQKALSTVDLIFRNGLDWQALLISLEKLRIEAEGAELSIQAIENKNDGAFVVRVNVPPDANKAEIEKYLKHEYDLAVKALDAKYYHEMRAKEIEVESYRRENANLMKLAEWASTRPIIVQANAESKLENQSMSGNRSINTGGGSYYESIDTGGGNYIQGNYINMHQDLSQAATQIQDLLEKLQKQGVTVDVAQEQVAQDLATQAQNNATMKDKLVKWGQSLGDATVSDVVKGVVKLAIRSAGIPLP
jgi:uncharacterized protein YjbI with pentapeptide repeats